MEWTEVMVLVSFAFAVTDHKICDVMLALYESVKDVVTVVFSQKFK